MPSVHQYDDADAARDAGAGGAGAGAGAGGDEVGVLANDQRGFLNARRRHEAQLSRCSMSFIIFINLRR